MESKLIRKNLPSFVLSPRRLAVGLACCFVAVLALGATAEAQSPSRSTVGPPAPATNPPPRAARSGPGGLTILTEPTGAVVRLRGGSEYSGQSPLDLPSNWTGPYSVLIEGGEAATTHGSLYVPADGTPPYTLSAGPGMSPKLFIQSFTYPGLPQLSSGHKARGLGLGIAATGALGASVWSQLRYRGALNDVGADATERAEEFKVDRNRWLGYAGVVWGMSAVDRWISARVGIESATSQRITLSAPSLTRFGVAWRSLLIPGAGQEFAGRSGRGTFWMGATFAAAGGALIADHSVRHQRRLLEDAIVALGTAPLSQQAAIQAEILNHSDDLQSAEDYRRGFVDAALGIYAASFIDALTFSLSPKVTGPKRVSAVPQFRPGASELSLQIRF